MTHCAILAQWVACMMLLGARPGLTLRERIVRSVKVVKVAEVPLQRSAIMAPRNAESESFAVYGFNETDYRIPAPSPKEDNGIDVDAVLVADLNNRTKFKENRTEWKVELDGASVQSFNFEKPETVAVPQPRAHQFVALLHRWKTKGINARSVHVALAVFLGMTLLVTVGMFLYGATGGTFMGMKNSDLTKSDSTLREDPNPAAKDADGANADALHQRADDVRDKLKKLAAKLKEAATQKKQDQQDRFDERLLRSASGRL